LTAEGLAKRVKSYMRVSQKQLYKDTVEIPKENNSNYQIMAKIREFLDVKDVTEIKRNRENFVELSYEVRTTRQASCDLLIGYLSTYPLFSSKQQDFLT
jgi:hypothetical protein